jgi:hypothetical protein
MKHFRWKWCTRPPSESHSAQHAPLCPRPPQVADNSALNQLDLPKLNRVAGFEVCYVP